MYFDKRYDKVPFAIPYRFSIGPAKNKQRWIQQAHFGYETYLLDLTNFSTIPLLKLTSTNPRDKSHTDSTVVLDIR